METQVHKPLPLTAEDKPLVDPRINLPRNGQLHSIKETESELDMDSPRQNSIDAALGNHVVVDLICLFSPAKDLLNLRLVNGLFYKEATNHLRSRHTPIFLDELKIRPFLQCMQARLEPQNNTFPFGNLAFCLDLSDESIKLLFTKIGDHIRGLKLLPHPCFFGDDYLPDYVDDDDVMRDTLLLANFEKRKLLFILPFTRNMEHLYIESDYALRLGASDLKTLPATFPRLRKISNLHEGGVPYSTPSDLIPLMSYLVSRAPVLDFVLLPGDNIDRRENDSLLAVQAIRMHHQHNLPILELAGSMAISPRTIRALSGFCLRSLHGRLDPYYYYNDITAAEEAYNIMSCVDWLGSRSEKMLELSVYIWKTHHPITFQIPPLAALRKLNLTCGRHDRIGDNECPVQPLTSNQFPNLRNLTLEYYKDGYGIFQQCSLTSVRTFRIELQLTLLTAPWNTILPNLTTLQFKVTSDRDHYEDDRNNLAFLLRHFPRITELKLVLGYGGEQDFWDILTGGAPRPPCTHDLLHGDIGGVLGDLEEPVNGVYQTPSLRNLRCLKKLHCWPETRSNLDAILYMTRTRHLVPLENITLHGGKHRVSIIQGRLTLNWASAEHTFNSPGLSSLHPEDDAAYQAHLSLVHGVVNFRFGIQASEFCYFWGASL